MPNRPPRPCAMPGCPNLRPCPIHGRRSTLPFKRDKARQALYDRKWQRVRDAQLASQPWCEDCLAQEIFTPATEVHHMQRHEGNYSTFISSPLRSLCHAHHSSRTLAEVKSKKRQR